jgi:hypothetical protein
MLAVVGTIMLGDGDSDDEPEGGKQKKKKKNKKEKKHKASQMTNVVGGAGLNQGLVNVTVYGSDDDDDDSRLQPPSRRGTGRKAGKEFHGLAKVDLTIPLREEEVMPERKHRVVPERPTEVTQQFVDASIPTKSKKRIVVAWTVCFER